MATTNKTPETAELSFNPLEGLRDRQIADVFSRILSIRFDTRVLASHFALSGAAAGFDPTAHSRRLLDYLFEVIEEDPETAARSFRETFQLGSTYRGVPSAVRPIQKEYFEIKEERTDLVMVKDLLRAASLRSGVIADIGCGRNKLGTAILRHADAESIAVLGVIGTDVSEYGAKPVDERLQYRQQLAGVLPIEGRSIDLVIVKWALHHMSHRVAGKTIAEIARILKPGGHVAIVEALMGDEALVPEFEAETRIKETWPDGDWFGERHQLTLDYLDLSLLQQRYVLALEDFYGHWLEQEFTWMPMPFNYIDASRLRSAFDCVGMHEDGQYRRVFGMTPIIHWGPPTMRLVFEKPQTRFA